MTVEYRNIISIATKLLLQNDITFAIYDGDTYLTATSNKNIFPKYGFRAASVDAYDTIINTETGSYNIKVFPIITSNNNYLGCIVTLNELPCACDIGYIHAIADILSEL